MTEPARRPTRVPGSARGLAPRLAALALGLVAVFAIGEIAVRVATRPAPQPDPDSPLPVLLPTAEVLRGANQRGLLIGKPFRTNALGFRGPERSARPAPGVFRIAITGDSVTMGWGVAEEDAYPALLESALSAADPSRRFEVINVGMAGIAIDEAIDRLETASAAYAPDLLVYGFTTNDIAGPAYRSLGPPHARVALMVEMARFRDAPSALLRAAWPRLVSLRERIRPSVPSYHAEVLHNYLDNPEAWQAFARGLDRLAALAKRSGRCAHVLLHTDLLDDFDAPVMGPVYDRVERAARQRGLSVSSSLEAHRAYGSRDLVLSTLDSHPNEHGHEVLAAHLQRALAALPERCWAPPATGTR